ncbi:flagellar M-ring protein FliF C-terminal domain-containing protein [Acidocella facilis]|uniref:flagellar M-ring protein FliF C-terminal domain-containing protein n=1 Tax=Acidocella facilis TaxID=525 RepID=UPI000478BDB9|nr:flagellar M-ring protein FliF C-terminal domain-containing protein [Acidocella facilis]
MADWRTQLVRVRTQAAQAPRLLLAGGAVIAASAALVGWLEFSSPPYAVLEEGLSPAEGGKVIATLQKLGIPYQLREAGDVILVPAPQLAQARLQLGAAQVPGDDVNNAWTQVENAPMTASDQAQQAMGNQALELSLQHSIEGLQGVRAAQVFLAIPAQTPFLADQPKPSASVVIDAAPAAAQAQGVAIAGLVAGAVPGMTPEQITVETTAGATVFPQTGAAGNAAQLATTGDIEAQAAARVADILTPLVGAGNFRTGIGADVDFTQVRTHQTLYGPGHLVQHAVQDSSQQSGATQAAAIGIPGALSNQPPAATTANPAPVPTQAGGAPATSPASTASAQGAQSPQQVSSQQDQTYQNDVSDSDITHPDWAVKGIAVSVVLNQAALGQLSTAQVKSAIASAFSYPAVSVNVLAAPFHAQPIGSGAVLGESSGALTHAALELLAALFVLFGLALPLSRRLKSVDLKAILTPPLPPPPPAPPPVLRPEMITPAVNFTPLREQVAQNPRGVASLLQSWADDAEGKER